MIASSLFCNYQGEISGSIGYAVYAIIPFFHPAFHALAKIGIRVNCIFRTSLSLESIIKTILTMLYSIFLVYSFPFLIIAFVIYSFNETCN